LAPYSLGLTTQDQYWLLDYLGGGGKLIAMGQDLASAVGANDGAFGILYGDGLGAHHIQDSISNGVTPQKAIGAQSTASSLFAGVYVDLTQARLAGALGDLTGAHEVPPNASRTVGDFQMTYDLDQNRLDFAVTVIATSTAPITLVGASINAGATGSNGPVVRSLLPANFAPKLVTDEYRFNGVLFDLSLQEIERLQAGQYYVNLRPVAFPAGEVRDQIKTSPFANQPFVDEVGTVADQYGRASNAVLRYDGPYNLFDGNVAVARRQYPSLEYPQIAFAGRSFYAAFGLEGMSEAFNTTLSLQPTSRAALLNRILLWLNIEPGVATLAETTPAGMSGLTVFTAHYAPPVTATREQPAQMAGAVRYRWDFGDGSPIAAWWNDVAGHSYLCGANNIYTVRVEATDDLGNVAIGSTLVDASSTCSTEPVKAMPLYLPNVPKP
jgi:hypothetical protein